MPQESTAAYGKNHEYLILIILVGIANLNAI